MCIGVGLYVYVYVHVCMCGFVCVNIYRCGSSCIYICVHEYVHVVCMCIVYVFEYVYVHVCMYAVCRLRVFFKKPNELGDGGALL